MFSSTIEPFVFSANHCIAFLTGDNVEAEEPTDLVSTSRIRHLCYYREPIIFDTGLPVMCWSFQMLGYLMQRHRARSFLSQCVIR